MPYELHASMYSDFPMYSLKLAAVYTESPRIEGFKFKEIGQTETVLDVDLAGYGLYAVPVYYRFRPLPSGSWGPIYVEIANPRGAKTRLESRLPLLTSSTEYEVQVSTYMNFLAIDTLNLTFTTLPPLPCFVDHGRCPGQFGESNRHDRCAKWNSPDRVPPVPGAWGRDLDRPAEHCHLNNNGYPSPDRPAHQHDL